MPRDRLIVPSEILELAELMRPAWARMQAELRVSGMPLNDGDDDDSTENDNSTEETEDDDDTSDDDSEDDDDSEGDDDSEDDEVKAELVKEKREKAAIQKRLAEAEKAKRKAERALRNSKRSTREESGEYKEMYEDEKKRNDELETKIVAGNLERAVTAEATEQSFREPSLVLRVADFDDAVDEDGEVDEDVVARIVKKLAKDKQYLVKVSKPQADSPPRGDRKRRQRDDAEDESDEPVRGAARMRRGYEAADSEAAGARS